MAKSEGDPPLLIGCDPEFFVRDPMKKVIAAFGMIPGTKHAPHPAGNGAVQVDGVALEFNTKPASSKAEFSANIVDMFERMESMLPKDFVLDRRASSHQFEEAYMKGLPEEARELGCEPDFNAYSGAENPEPDEESLMRTTAGHVHLGWDEGLSVKDPAHFSSCMTMAKELDIRLGIPSLLLDPDGNTRRLLYGSAGAFRMKPYGMEYRTLSNFWCDNQTYRDWVFDSCVDSYEALMGWNDKQSLQARIAPNTVRATIAYNDQRSARQIISACGLTLP